MEIIEEKFVKTPRYGTLKFIKTNKGWTWQYDTVLLWGIENNDDILKFLDNDNQESGEYMPEIDDIEEYFETFEEAKENCLENMSQMFHTGCIAVWK